MSNESIYSDKINQIYNNKFMVLQFFFCTAACICLFLSTYWFRDSCREISDTK